MFSIVGAALTLFLLESDRPRRALFALPLFAVWANLHGAWLYGLAMIGAFILGDLAEAALSSERRQEWIATAKTNSVMLIIGAAATLINPYGLRLHKEVLFAATSSSLAKNIAEYLAPNFQDAGQWPFLLAVLGTVGLFAIGTKRIQLPWLILILMSLFFALRSFRNIALFGVSAWPLVALHAAASWPRPKKPFRFFSEFARLDPGARIGILIVPVAALMLALGLNRGSVGSLEIIPDHFNPGKFPVAAVARAREAKLPGRVFDAWGWGGYIMYAWPDARLHVDPLKFNDETIKSYSTIEEMRPGWQKEMDRWNIQTVLIHVKSPMAKGMAMEPEWKAWYRDTLAVVYRRANN